MMLTGIAPWEGSNRKEIEASISKESADVKKLKEFLTWFSNHMGASKEAQDFICQLVLVDVKKRLSAQTALKHPWLKGGSVSGGAAATSGRSSFGAVEVARLKKFSTQNKLKRTAMLAISFGASAEQLKDIGESSFFLSCSFLL